MIINVFDEVARVWDDKCRGWELPALARLKTGLWRDLRAQEAGASGRVLAVADVQESDVLERAYPDIDGHRILSATRHHARQATYV